MVKSKYSGEIIIFMHKRILLILSFSLLFFSYGFGARKQVRKARKAHVIVPVQAYVDSLAIYRAKLDSVCAQNDSLGALLSNATAHSRNYGILSPLTFYRGVSGRMFSLDDQDIYRLSADQVLMKLYLSHPELVRETERELIESGEIAYRPDAPVRQDVDMTSQTEQETIFIPSASDDVLGGGIQLVTVKPNFWSFKGDYSLQFLQNYVSSNWYKGGESSYAMIGSATMQLNYNDKEKIRWENKLELKLGMQSSQGDDVHKYRSSEDLIRLTSKLGVQANKRWYYTLQTITSTQFTHGYKANDANVYSDFMSPMTFNLSLGMENKVQACKKKLTGTVNISPLSANLKYVDRLSLATNNGIDEGKHSKLDFGSTFTADLEWKFSDMLRWQTRLYAFTNYKRTEMEWENTLTFQLSKYISTKLFIYPRFDDSSKTFDADYGYFQLKEYWSLGFNYTM